MRMSGSVCVWDSQRRPLLPTSAAYARTLVQQHKAVLLPHPAVSLLQLSHAVSEPVLRPVLLGIALHPTTATALIFTEALGNTPLLSLTLDLHGITGAAPQAVALTMLVRTLGLLLPISQGALLTHLPVTNDAAHAAAIHTIMTTLEACLRYPITLLSFDTPRIAEYPLLGAFQQQIGIRHDACTDIAAMYMPQYETEPHPPVTFPRAVRLAETDHATLTAGMAVQVRQDEEVITGVVQAGDHDDIWVQVPNKATPAGVVWADMRVLPPLRGWLWEAQPITLLPVAQRKSDRKG
jgi:hypothetical protein